MGVKIIDTKLKFTHPLTKRSKTVAIILHHTAGTGTVQSLHNEHLGLGWSGIGYNFYIRQDGSVYKGRGWEYVGAHAGASNDYNSKSVGIAFEGNYSELTSMPAAQYNSGVSLIKDALGKYGKITILGHRDVCATACPGTHFPFEKIKADAVSKPVSVPVKAKSNQTKEEDDMAKIIEQIAAAAGLSTADTISALGTLVKYANTKTETWEKDGADYLKNQGLISDARDGREMVEFGELGVILKRFADKIK